jgi:hypothetical protein
MRDHVIQVCNDLLRTRAIPEGEFPPPLPTAETQKHASESNDHSLRRGSALVGAYNLLRKLAYFRTIQAALKQLHRGSLSKLPIGAPALSRQLCRLQKSAKD